MKNTTEAIRLFDELDSNIENFKQRRRKLSQTLRKVCTWFNKELRAAEDIPKEFSEYITTNQSQQDILKMKYIWSRTI